MCVRRGSQQTGDERSGWACRRTGDRETARQITIFHPLSTDGSSSIDDSAMSSPLHPYARCAPPLRHATSELGLSCLAREGARVDQPSSPFARTGLAGGRDAEGPWLSLPPAAGRVCCRRATHAIQTSPHRPAAPATSTLAAGGWAGRAAVCRPEGKRDAGRSKRGRQRLGSAHALSLSPSLASASSHPRASRLHWADSRSQARKMGRTRGGALAAAKGEDVDLLKVQSSREGAGPGSRRRGEVSTRGRRRRETTTGRDKARPRRERGGKERANEQAREKCAPCQPCLRAHTRETVWVGWPRPTARAGRARAGKREERARARGPRPSARCRTRTRRCEWRQGGPSRRD